jgi:hypothetical protein
LDKTSGCRVASANKGDGISGPAACPTSAIKSKNHLLSAPPDKREGEAAEIVVKNVSETEPGATQNISSCVLIAWISSINNVDMNADNKAPFPSRARLAYNRAFPPANASS